MGKLGDLVRRGIGAPVRALIGYGGSDRRTFTAE